MLLSLACSTISCSGTKEQGTLNRAEALMESHPDSALTLLSTIDKRKLYSKKQEAQYALLMSMALDKNCIDTTTFEVLQPAIDYYLSNGSPNEQLRTYYYQGRIFQNQGDRDKALNSFVKGTDIISTCDDYLCIARLLVAQGGLYNEFYDFNSYTDCHLEAAKIYKFLGLPKLEFDCLLNALNGSILLKNKAIGDSIINLCNSISQLSDTEQSLLYGYNLSHTLNFGSKEDLEDLVSLSQGYSELDLNGLLNLASAHHKLGNNELALQTLKNIDNFNSGYDTLKYQAIQFPILKDLGYYKDALAVYQDFSSRLESINSHKFSQKAQSVVIKKFT